MAAYFLLYFDSGGKRAYGTFEEGVTRKGKIIWNVNNSKIKNKTLKINIGKIKVVQFQFPPKIQMTP